MKTRKIQIVGDLIIALVCAVPTAFFAEQYNEGYKYLYNLFMYESDYQLLTMAKWYISRCWIVVGCGVSLLVLLMSAFSLIIKANSFKHNITFIILSIFFAVMVFGINQLLGVNASLQFLLGIVNRILIYTFILVFGFRSYFDSKKQRLQKLQNN